jgi:hypothetical protein
MLSLNELLDLWRFQAHPFESYTAEQEPRLAEYFVPPPYVDDVVGDPTSPSPAIVFGARGLGKSALRLFIENRCMVDDQAGALAVTYDAFEAVLARGLENATLDRHLRAILERMVCALLARVADAHVARHGETKPTQDTLKALFPDLEIEPIAKLVGRYFAPLPEIQKERAFRSVSDFFRGRALRFSDRASRFQAIWTVIRVPLIDLVNLVQAARGKEPVSPVQISGSEARAIADTTTLLSDLELIASLGSRVGVTGWYILVDKVDETNETDGDAEKAAKLMLPLLKSLNSLETRGVGFKFFLWDQVRPFLVEQRVRLDKLRNWSIAWEDAELRNMIDTRLKVFSQGAVATLTEILEEPTSDVYGSVLEHAMRSPREIVQALDAIFREHARHSDHNTGALVTGTSIDLGLDEYCRRRVADLYSPEVIHGIRQLPASTFTSTGVQTTFRISQPAASLKIGKWVDNGLVERIEDVRSEKDPSKPVHQYRVREARLRRMIERSLTPLGAV